MSLDLRSSYSASLKVQSLFMDELAFEKPNGTTANHPAPDHANQSDNSSVLQKSFPALMLTAACLALPTLSLLVNSTQLVPFQASKLAIGPG